MSSKARAGKAKKRSLTNEIMAVILALVAILLLFSLFTYDPKDPSWHSVGPQQKPTNFIGPVGAYASNLLLEWFGIASLAIPVLLIFIGWRMFFTQSLSVPVRKAIGSTFLLIAISGFLALFPTLGIAMLEHSASNGGMIGYIVEGALAGVLNTIGAGIVLTFAMVVLLMLTLEFSVTQIIARVRGVKGKGLIVNQSGMSLTERLKTWWAESRERRRLAAEELRQAKAEQLQLREQESLAREQELLAEQMRRKKLEEESREKRQKVKEEQPQITTPLVVNKEKISEAQREPLITPQIAKTFRPEALAQTGKDSVKPETEEPQETQRFAASAQNQTAVASATPTTATARTQAAEAYRAYTTKTEQLRNGRDLAEVTMDPEVAEMTSTAYIERTTPTKPLPASKPEKESTPKRKAVTTIAHYEMPSINLLEVPIGHSEQAEEELRERATILAEKCKEFGVVGHIHRINPGSGGDDI